MKKQWIILLLFASTVLNAQDKSLNATDEAISVVDTPAVLDNSERSSSTTYFSEDEVLSIADKDQAIVDNAVIQGYEATLDYIVNKGSKIYASPKALFEIQGVDNQSGLKEILVSIDGMAFSTYKGPISFSEEGEHTLIYKFIDYVGNISYSNTYSVNIDATPPRILDLVMDPAPYKASGYEYIGPNTEFSFKAHDDITGVGYVEYRANDQKDMIRFNGKTKVSSLGLNDKSIVTLFYQATDMVGNTSAIKSKTFIMDAKPPAVNVFAKAFEKDGIRYISTNDTITAEAYDYDTAVSNIVYAINDGEFQTYDPKIGINIKTCGKYKVRVKATDVVGNESAEEVYEVIVDAAAPIGKVSYVGHDRSKQYGDQLMLGNLDTQNIQSNDFNKKTSDENLKNLFEREENSFRIPENNNTENTYKSDLKQNQQPMQNFNSISDEEELADTSEEENINSTNGIYSDSETSCNIG